MRRARVSRRAALAALAGIPALAACTRIGAHAGSAGSPPAVGSMMPEVKDLTVDVARADPGGVKAAGPPPSPGAIRLPEPSSSA